MNPVRNNHVYTSAPVFFCFQQLPQPDWTQTHLLTLQSYTLGSVQWQGSSTCHNPPLPTPPLHTPRPTSTSRNQHKGKRQQERKIKEWSISYPSVPDVFQRVMVDESPADRSRACRLHCRSHYAIASVMLETG